MGGLGAVIFRGFIHFAHGFFFSDLFYHSPSPYFIVLLPVIGGLIVGPIVYSLAPEIRGDGIPQIMEALQRRGGEIRKRVGIILICVAAITVGSGGSAGREGPIAQIGASFGSLIGQAFRLDSKDIKLLTVCGVAAGIAGTFNAPMGGAIFSMEVIYRRFSPYDAVPVLLAAVVGKAMAVRLINPAPDFINPEFIFSTSDLALCFILGPIFGILAAFWVKTYYHFEDFFDWLPIPNKLKPAAGGFVAGISGLYFLDYGIMGVGYEGINHVFHITSNSSNSLLILLVVLGIFKILATASTVGSGGSGGLFAPTLYIGTMFGVIFGMIASDAFPGMVVDSPAYGLLGMGAFFAGAARAPLTCIVMIPEMASNYSRLPPLIISCTLSYVVAQIILKGGSIYNTKLMRKGIYLDIPEPVLNKVSIGEAMHRKVVTVTSQMTIFQARKYLFQYNYTGFPVMDENKLTGMVTFDDVRKVPLELQNDVLVGDVAVKNVITVRPDQSVKYAMDLMYQNGIGRLPVVEPDNPKKLVGIITRTDAIRIYESEAR
ncbi:MAG: chloride channel protein [Methanotrichaceae archaeon]